MCRSITMKTFNVLLLLSQCSCLTCVTVWRCKPLTPVICPQTLTKRYEGAKICFSQNKSHDKTELMAWVGLETRLSKGLQVLLFKVLQHAGDILAIGWMCQKTKNKRMFLHNFCCCPGCYSEETISLKTQHRLQWKPATDSSFSHHPDKLSSVGWFPAHHQAEVNEANKSAKGTDVVISVNTIGMRSSWFPRLKKKKKCLTFSPRSLIICKTGKFRIRKVK